MYVHIMYNWDLLNCPVTMVNQLVFHSKTEQRVNGKREGLIEQLPSGKNT